jgi:hypothetical protein
MHFIEHIIEPTKLLLAWQSSDEKHRTRYIVAELNRIGNQITLTYLINTDDFHKAQSKGFESYPAFPEINKTHHNVLDAFMRRLPPRSRGDFSQYMEGLRLKPETPLSDFALLGYSGAKLPSDGFSIIHPFNNVDTACELLLEAAGFRHIQKNHSEIKIGDTASFVKEFNDVTQEEAIHVMVDGKHIGYVNRGLLATFFDWMNGSRIIGAWIEKINGTPGKPAVYVYVKISSVNKHFRTIVDNELKDFETECYTARINPKEFQFHEHDIVETPLNNGLFTTNAKITVTRKNISKTYSTGNATHWVADFAKDLRNGVFN